MHILFNSLLGKASSTLHWQTTHITANVLCLHVDQLLRWQRNHYLRFYKQKNEAGKHTERNSPPWSTGLAHTQDVQI